MDLGCQCLFIYSAVSNDSFTEQTNKDPRYPHNVHLFRQFCVLVLIKIIRIEHCFELTQVFNMHVEGNRRAFIHDHNFKTFFDRLSWVRMYEDQI